MTFYNELQLHKAPKIDLHVHLQGAGNLHVISYLLNKHRDEVKQELANDQELAKRIEQFPVLLKLLNNKQLTIEEDDTLFTYESIEQFFSTYKLLCLFIRDRSDLELYIRGVLIKLRRQNIVFADIIVSLPELIMQKMSVSDVLHILDKHSNANNIQINWWVDLVRHKGSHDAFQLLSEVVKHNSAHVVVGINLGGRETKENLESFSKVFKLAKDNGLRIIVHDGETQVVANQDLYKKNNIERISHGLNYIHDKSLPDTYIEACVTSNFKTKIIKNVYYHPVFKGNERLNNVVICTDDPTLFNTSLAKELSFILSVYGKSGLIKVISNAHFCAGNALPMETIEWYDKHIKE